MAACQLRIEIDEPGKAYRGGDTIQGTIVARVEKTVNCNGLVVTSGWSTHGSGNIDRAEIDSVTVFTGPWSAGQEYRYPFALRTATWPPTYYGTHLNVSHGLLAKAKLSWAIDPTARLEYPVVADVAPEDLAPERRTKSSSFAWLGWSIAVIFVVAVGWMLLFLVPILLIVAAIVWFFTSYLPKSVTGKVECSVDPMRTAAGETIRGRVAFTPKRRTQLNGVSVIIKADEICVSGSGSNSRTHTQSLHSHPVQLLDRGFVSPGQLLEFPFEYRLPADAAPSLALNDNKLTWEVKFRVDIPRWPDWTKTIPLVVAPSLDIAQGSTTTIQSERGWLGQVVDQLIATRTDAERQQLVLQAVKEDTFDVQLQVEERLPDGITPRAAEQGVWYEANEPKLDATFFLLFPPGARLPSEGSNWTGQIQINGFDEEVIAKVVS